MKKVNKYLEIDFLRKNSTKIHYFGLGFIQIIMNDTERVHYYNINLPPIIDDGIHNHRYNFKSSVIKGTLIEELYQIVNTNTKDYIISNESCSKERELKNIVEIDVSVKSLGVINQKTEYYRFFNEFHKVNFDENTITLINRSPIITDYAQVIRHKSLDKICPFSKNLPAKESWEYVEDTILN